MVEENVSAGALPLVRASAISKRFGGVQALDDVSLDVWDHDIVGLVGDNGAGKSTFVKILSGVYMPTHGNIAINGVPVTLASPADARQYGIETVYQDLALLGSFTVAENFFLGRETVYQGWMRPFLAMRKRAMAAAAAASLAELSISIPDLRSNTLNRMSGGQRQAVAIARGAFWGQRCMLLDEPTAALGVRESREVLSLIERMAERGIAMVIVSHNMEHLWSVCNRVVVFRRGQKVADLPKKSTTAEEVVAYITGALSAYRE